MSAARTQPETETTFCVIGHNLGAQGREKIRAGLLFDAVDSERPRLDAELERERAEAARLRRELRKSWRVEDRWRNYLKGIGAL